MNYLLFEIFKNDVKTSLLLFYTLVLTITSSAQTGSFLDRTKLALKSGSSQKLSQLMAEKVQMGFEGESAMLTQKDAENKLTNFFKSNIPTDISQLFQGQSKDGKQYFICKLKSSGGEFRVSVYWSETPRNQMISIDISRE
jgi:hypothetical protein